MEIVKTLDGMLAKLWDPHLVGPAVYVQGLTRRYLPSVSFKTSSSVTEELTLDATFLDGSVSNSTDRS